MNNEIKNISGNDNVDEKTKFSSESDNIYITSNGIVDDKVDNIISSDIGVSIKRNQVSERKKPLAEKSKRNNFPVFPMSSNCFYCSEKIESDEDFLNGKLNGRDYALHIECSLCQGYNSLFDK